MLCESLVADWEWHAGPGMGPGGMRGPYMFNPAYGAPPTGGRGGRGGPPNGFMNPMVMPQGPMPVGPGRGAGRGRGRGGRAGRFGPGGLPMEDGVFPMGPGGPGPMRGGPAGPKGGRGQPAGGRGRGSSGPPPPPPAAPASQAQPTAPVVPPAASAVVPGQEGGNLTTAMLAAAPPEQQKQMLGERLFPLVAVSSASPASNTKTALFCTAQPQPQPTEDQHFTPCKGAQFVLPLCLCTRTRFSVGQGSCCSAPALLSSDSSCAACFRISFWC